MTDHYAALGVPKTASAAEIKQAFRKLASQHHPDKGGDTAKFQAIQAAYATLGDEAKRAEYDHPRPQFGGFGGFGQPGGSSFNFDDMVNMFTRQQTHTQRRQHMRMSLWIRLADVAQGGKRPVSLGSPQGNTVVEIEIPLGIEDGDNVQYQGLAPNGQDLVVQFRVHPDPKWERQGLNLIIEHNVPVWDLITGADITVDTLAGSQVISRIPARTQPRTLLRLKGQGLRDRQGNTGDILVRLNARLPDAIHPELLDAIEKHR
jgi:curved DNA-binding protein